MSGEDRGCCRHCVDGCYGYGGSWDHAAQRATPAPANGRWQFFAVWDDGHCPMCAEAERLAAEYEHRAQMKRTSAEEWGLVTAARIARGEA